MASNPPERNGFKPFVFEETADYSTEQVRHWVKQALQRHAVETLHGSLQPMTVQDLLSWRPDEGIKPEKAVKASKPRKTLGKKQAVKTISENIEPASNTYSEPKPALLSDLKPSALKMPAVSDHYEFRPFSFQEPSVALQSETPLAGVSSSFPISSSHVEPQASAYSSQQPFNGGPMVDLSGYKDLTKPPVSSEEPGYPSGSNTAVLTAPETSYQPETENSYMSSPQVTSQSTATSPYAGASFGSNQANDINENDIEIYAEYSGNVKTLVQLVNDLPDGVTKQTGAQIIRLTMEAMGISMENVLSDAQRVQSELLDAVRANIKKIEEYKTVIRKLESEIRFHQGKANELSEIIDLFILSNTTPNMPNID